MRGKRGVRVSGGASCLTLTAIACVLGAVAAAQTGRLALAVFLAGMVALLAAAVALLGVLQGDWLQAAAYAVVAAYWAWLWWQFWRRRRRKRSLKVLGEKMRAVFAAMARNMRPGPVLRPAPQGARA
jgi:hypothetical protein